MTKLCLLVASGLWLAFPKLVLGDIGQNVGAVLAKYGVENLYPPPLSRVVPVWQEPDPEKAVRRWFHNGQIIICVTFFGGKSISEAYYLNVGVLTPKQVKGLLSDYSGGSTWKVVLKSSQATDWVRVDGKLLARLHSAPPGLDFFSPEYHDILKTHPLQ